MSSDTLPDLLACADWLRANDHHADHHLALIRSVEQTLSSGPPYGEPGLTEKLERWRYQHLHERAGQLGSDDDAFLDALDVTTNELAGRPERPPRRAAKALDDASLDTDAMLEAFEVLDARYPLNRLVARAAELTDAHFTLPVPGQPHSPPCRRMLLYAPLYVSSHCVNYCTYCGFRYPLDIRRRHLTVEEAMEQIVLLRQRGLEHLLIVGGDYPQLTSTAYYCQMARAVARLGAAPGIEIAPQGTGAYAQLVAAGVCGLTLYQETYDPRLYAAYHVRGPKAHYHWRLESHERAAEAGMPRLGLGVLLGLADVCQEVPALMRHAAYLQERFPDRTLAFSLPRIHEAPDGFVMPHPASDEQLIRLYCALRVAFPQAELVLSTRERAELRNQLAEICITQMSAGSSTAPGGYDAGAPATGEQFPVADHRTTAEVARWLEQSGFRVAWSTCHARVNTP